MQVSESNHFYGFLDLCSLQKFMEILGPVVTWLLNATLVRSGHVFKKCKARQVASIRSVGISCDVLKVEINYDKLWNMTALKAQTYRMPWTKSSTLASTDGRCRRLFIMSSNLPVAQIHFI